MPVKTAVCETPAGDLDLVHCKLWENWHGATNIQKTREQLAADHPNLKFVGWVYDLNNDEDVQSLRLAFLSPNVQSIRKFILKSHGVEMTTVTREMVA